MSACGHEQSFLSEDDQNCRLRSASTFLLRLRVPLTGAAMHAAGAASGPFPCRRATHSVHSPTKLLLVPWSRAIAGVCGLLQRNSIKQDAQNHLEQQTDSNTASTLTAYVCTRSWACSRRVSDRVRLSRRHQPARLHAGVFSAAKSGPVPRAGVRYAHGFCYGSTHLRGKTSTHIFLQITLYPAEHGAFPMLPIFW